MFKVNNKDTKTTPYSSVSIANFEQVNVDWILLPFWGFMVLSVFEKFSFAELENCYN